MESSKPQMTRSLSGQRVSIRRKTSFNKVRQLFENKCKISENGGSSSISKTNSSKQLNIQSKYDLLKVIDERDMNCGQNSVKPRKVIIGETTDSLQCNDLPIDEKLVENLNDCPFVKNTINFFEHKSNYDKIDDKKCNHTRNVTQDSKFDDNYGNVDKMEKSYQLKYDCSKDKASEEWKHSFETIHINAKNNDNYVISSDNLQQTEIESTNDSTNYRRSLSITSISSLTSDFVSFDSEPEVVFRKPEIRSSQNRPIRPIPKQRTSIVKISDKHDHLHKLDKSDDTLKTMTDCPQSQLTRISVRSQDSGISDTSLNSSYLHSNKKSDQTNDDTQEDQNSSGVQIQIDPGSDIQQDDQIYEHIYEELINYRSLTASEWIDIDNNNNKQTIRPDILSNRRSQNLRPNNYRKSFRPKLHKRKTNKTSHSVIKSSDQCSDSARSESGSATEYEDIEDDQVYDSTIESLNFAKSQITDKPVIRQNSYHIYELMSDKDVVQLRDQRQRDDVKAKLVRELSIRLAKNDQTQITDQSEDISNKTVFECKPNIYTSTPRRLERTLSGLNSKRDSMLSRNSSIYINPNVCHISSNDSLQNMVTNSNFSKNRETFEKQISMTGSIASYLELNISCVDNCSPFNSEPLYQFYQKDVRRRAELWIHFDQNLTDLEYDVYENNKIYGTTSENEPDSISNNCETQFNSDRIHSLCKRNISALDFIGFGPNRSLWCQLPQVINSKDNLLSTLSDKEKRLQESMFEIIASEASYCKSLNILVSHFYDCSELCESNPQILSLREKKCLFSNIMDISRISSNLLKALKKRFEQNILLYDVCDILCDYAINQFQPYIHYCAYQRDQEKLLTQLTQSRSAFVEIVQRLESNQICQNQSLLSFLMLPMQRITRYPLLIDAVCQQLPSESPILDSLRRALGVVNQLVRKCNEETKKVQRMQELIEIEKILHFRSKMKSYPIVSGARYLVKKGPVLKLSPQLSAKKTIGKSTLKWSKSSMYLFLFSDLLILAKKKSENHYSVFDYCCRSTLQLIPLTHSGDNTGLIGSLRIAVPRNYGNLCQLILLHNHESKSVEYTISFELESEKLRWIEAMSQPSSDNPNEVIYEEWDCPQVQCIKSYCAQQTDEISLEETDVLNVFRKMKDGWFEGQRIRDGLKGWFPSDFTEEIINQHVRARNIRLRHRLLMYTQSVIEEQKSAKLK